MGPFSGEFLTVAQTVFLKSFKSGMTSLLNSGALSKTNPRGIGYQDSHVLLRNWLVLADVLLM